MVDPIFDYQFRLILVGDSTVGKSSLLRAFTEGKYAQVCEPTVGVDFFARLVEVSEDVRVKLQLWDTAGQERFRSITRSYYRNSVGVLLVYDVTKKASFDHVADWLYEARRHIEPHKAVFHLVGCKCDMECSREVTHEEAKQFARFYRMSFLETSAKAGFNVEKVFTLVAQEVYSRILLGDLKAEDGWEGIKNGFARPTASLQLVEAEAERDKCC